MKTLSYEKIKVFIFKIVEIIETIFITIYVFLFYFVTLHLLFLESFLANKYYTKTTYTLYKLGINDL